MAHNRPFHGAPPPGHQPQAGYQQPTYPPHPEAIFVNAPRAETSITRMTVPAVMVVSLAAALVWATYAATSQFGDIKHAIDKLSSRIEALTGELSQRIGRLEQNDADRWSKKDHEIWCAKAERANQSIGWTCGDDAAPNPRPAPVPQVNGWTARAKP